MASMTWSSSKSSEPSIFGTYPTRTPSRITCASSPAVPSVSQIAYRPSGSITRIPNCATAARSRCAGTPRARSASTTRWARFSSMISKDTARPSLRRRLAGRAERHRGHLGEPVGGGTQQLGRLRQPVYGALIGDPPVLRDVPGSRRDQPLVGLDAAGEVAEQLAVRGVQGIVRPGHRQRALDGGSTLTDLAQCPLRRGRLQNR